MKFRGYRIHIILITCALIVAIGFSAQRFVYGRHVHASIVADFKHIDGVDAVELIERGKYTDVALTVESVPDFLSLYNEASQLSRERLGEKSGEIVIYDTRTPELEDAFDRIHLALYEAAATGQFTYMQSAVKEILANTPVDEYTLSVDHEAIYVQLYADDAVMRERIVRTGPGIGTVSIGGVVR